MQDIIITSKRIRKETYILSACFGVAFLTNIAAIILYKTPWFEIITQLGYVVAITLFLYFLAAAARAVAFLIRKLIKNIVSP